MTIKARLEAIEKKLADLEMRLDSDRFAIVFYDPKQPGEPDQPGRPLAPIPERAEVILYLPKNGREEYQEETKEV